MRLFSNKRKTTKKIVPGLAALFIAILCSQAHADACWDPEHYKNVQYKGSVGSLRPFNQSTPIANAVIEPAWYFKSGTSFWTPGFVQGKSNNQGNFSFSGRSCMAANKANPAIGFIRVWAPGHIAKVVSASIYGDTVDIGKVVLAPAKKTVGWAGLRESFYGATSNGFDEVNPDAEVYNFPSVDDYSAGIKNTSAAWVTTVYNTAIWNVTEVDYDTQGIIMQFAKPNNAPNDSKFTFTTKLGKKDFELNHDAYLNKFDQDSKSRIFLGIEPGHANINTTIKLILEKYKNHSSVAGISVDTEFYEYAGEWDDESQWPAHPCANPDKPEALLGCNKKVSDDTALYWDMLIKSYNPSYRLILKHWNPAALPPKYRGDIIFVTDTQETGSLKNHQNEVAAWSKAFAGNDIMLQAGYPADWDWISALSPNDTAKLPYEMAKAMLPQIDSHQAFGIVWVDFSLRKTFPKIFKK